MIVRVILALALAAVGWFIVSSVLASNASAAANDGAGATNLLAQNMFNGILFGLLLALASVGISLVYVRFYFVTGTLQTNPRRIRTGAPRRRRRSPR